jgi:voltage-gated potassium channel Kch
MNRLLGSPLRNLLAFIFFVLAVVVIATAAYMAAGWSFIDAVYMVVLTIYTVGFQEVRPVNTPFLHGVTIGLIVLGCTGMILVTGALVQVLTFSQIQTLLGANRMKNDIERLNNHIIVCGFGRIGVMLAKELSAGRAEFVILDRSESRLAEARELGYLCVQGDASDEAVLQSAGIERARVLATVLPDDAANVFITLTARSLNQQLQIIARGEAPSTESKLIQAGADKVVLPTHIGAERIAEMVLFPDSDRFVRGSQAMRDFEKQLRDLGLDVELLIAAERSQAAGSSIEALERLAKGAFFVVRINRKSGDIVTRPSRGVRIETGDGVLVVSRNAGAVTSYFATPPERMKAGRTTF